MEKYMNTVDRNAAHIAANLVERLQEARGVSFLLSLLEEPWEHIAFGKEAALLINYILYRVRDNGDRTFVLAFNAVEADLHMKRHRQEVAIQRLIEHGVLSRLHGGYRNVRRFEWQPEVYMEIKARIEEHPDMPDVFKNKYDKDKVAERKREKWSQNVHALVGLAIENVERLTGTLGQLKIAVEEGRDGDPAITDGRSEYVNRLVEALVELELTWEDPELRECELESNPYLQRTQKLARSIYSLRLVVQALNARN